jgi:hypothetical protein
VGRETVTNMTYICQFIDKMSAEYFNTFRAGINRGRVGRKRGRSKKIKKKERNVKIRGVGEKTLYISVTLQRTYLMQIPATGFES